VKDGPKQIVGRTITSVVVASNDAGPQNQAFLVFDDGTRVEFWGPLFSCAGGVDRGGVEEAVRYAQKLGAEITAVYPARES